MATTIVLLPKSEYTLEQAEELDGTSFLTQEPVEVEHPEAVIYNLDDYFSMMRSYQSIAEVSLRDYWHCYVLTD